MEIESTTFRQQDLGSSYFQIENSKGNLQEAINFVYKWEIMGYMMGLQNRQFPHIHGIFTADYNGRGRECGALFSVEPLYKIHVWVSGWCYFDIYCHPAYIHLYTG